MKRLVALALVVAVAFGAAGCGKKTDTKTTEKEATKTEETKKTEETSEKTTEPSGYVVVGNANFNGEFIDGWGNSSYDNNVRKLVFGGASTAQAGLMTSDEGGKIILNSIVESRTTSEDGLTHTFKLKPGLLYSDGTPLNADDVVFTYEFYLDAEALTEAGGSSSLPEYLESVKKVDDLTVELKTKEKFYATDANVFTGGILSKEWAEKDKPADKTVQQHVKDSLISNPVGYGPYKLVEYKENQFVKLTVNENYVGNFRGSKPQIKDIIIKVVSNETDIDELVAEDIDILAGTVEAEKIDQVKDEDYLTYSNYPRHGYGHLTFHTDFGVAKYKEVRQAIAYTIDRKTFREAFLGGYSMSTDGPYSTNYWMIDTEWVDNNLTKYTANKAKVDEILTAAGWAKGTDGIWAKDGEKLEIDIAAPSQSWADALNLTLGKTGEEYGIKFNVEVIDFSILLNHYYGKEITDVNERKYEMFALATSLTIVFDGYTSWHSDKIVDPWGSGTSTNNPRFKNEKNDELLVTIRTAENDDVYQQAYRDWVKLMNEEMPILPLYSNDYHDLYNARIKGFKTSALWDWTAAIIESTVE